MTRTSSRALIAGVSLLCISLATPAFAQATPEVGEEDIRTAGEIVVQAQIGYRNRSEEPEPTLIYDEQYFQRFEPLTAGDALKRVPSVTFLADVIESDGARLRGLDPGYTQILINGEKVPGTQADRSFFLDRIPAELIKQVEIVRSSSARRTGDAVAGTLNIVLRDGFALDGGYVRGGALRFDDGEVKPSLGAVYGGALGEGRVLLGLNIQGRYNPKKKFSLRYGDSPENRDDFETTFQNREDQSDVRDGTDYSFNANYAIEGESRDFDLAGFFVRTNRTETERSFEYNKPTGVAGPVPGAVTPASPLGLLSDNANINRIKQQSFSITSKFVQRWSAGETKFKAGFASFDDEQNETENEIDFNRATPRFTPDLTVTGTRDEEISAGVEHDFDIGEDFKFGIGGYYQVKDRKTDIRTGRARRNLTNAIRTWDQFRDNPDTLVTVTPALAFTPGSINTIEEKRLDGFALIEGKSGIASFEAGLRYETTDIDIDDRTVAAGLRFQSTDYAKLLPSASLKLDLTSVDRITISAARTVRRPRLDFLSSARLLAEFGDNDFLGNPLLRPETATGGDIGYERRLGKTGVAGVNIFYRKIKNLVELASTGMVGSEGPGTVVLQPRNTGDGEVYGVEFDLSTDLGFLGLPNTGIFGNFSYLESDIRDDFGSRRFNGQSKYVYNAGFIQDIRSFAAAFGATYRKQGRAFDRIVGEEIVTTYGADLEIFIEKRFANKLTIRAVGSNLLDGAKRERFNKFTTIGDQAMRIFDEFELESETAGPVFQVIARYAF